uniref:Nuclear receptor subfamily 1 group D member 2 n=1 Tax=Pelodiscus sinensis TaxID=13735 RepID=K7G8S3_PELSI
QGFFRRSIQQNISYKMCVKNENCMIMRMNRNRCQHCRFKKCLAVGMSRDAVRFGRIPKREKQRLLDEMQSYMNSLGEAPMEDQAPAVGDTVRGGGIAGPAPATPVTHPFLFPAQRRQGWKSTPRAPPSPDAQEEEAIGAISRAYHDIFVSGQDRLGTTLTSSSATAMPAGRTSRPTCASPATAPAPMRSPPTWTTGPAPSAMTSTRPSRAATWPTPGTTPSSTTATPRAAPRRPVPGARPPAEAFSSCPPCFSDLAHSAHQACPLNASPYYSSGRSSQQGGEEVSMSFTPAVKEVVEFAKSIPGFQSLCQQDQVMLLKAGTFQVLMVRFSSLFNPKEKVVTFLSGETYSLCSLRTMGMGCLLDAMFEFSEKLSSLGLDAQEMALFMAVVLVSADRSGISDVDAVEILQETLIRALRTLVTKKHPDDSTLFPKLLLRLPDLRTLNNQHSEKLLAFRIDP